MLVHTTLPTQTFSHAWNPQGVPYCPLPFTPSLIHPPERRYACRSSTTILRVYTGKDEEINIDDVLLEAESALQAAETSLSSPPPPVAKNEKEESSTTDLLEVARSSVDAMAGAMGGIVLGGLLGTVTFLQFPDLDMLISPVILPIIFSFILGTIGFASGFVETPAAAAFRQVLGSPVKGILSSLGLLALKQVEKGAEEVKAIPSKVAQEVKSIPSKVATSVANSVNEKVEQVSNDIQEFPSKVATATKDKVSESLENVNLVGVTLAVVMVPVLLSLWLYYSNSDPLGGGIISF